MRTATIRTAHADPTTVAAAVSPDNTPEMNTDTDDRTVVTTVKRESTAGLRSTVDDYIVNIGVADAVIRCARAFDAETDHGGPPGSDGRNSETTDTNPQTNTNIQ